MSTVLSTLSPEGEVPSQQDGHLARRGGESCGSIICICNKPKCRLCNNCRSHDTNRNVSNRPGTLMTIETRHKGNYSAQFYVAFAEASKSGHGNACLSNVRVLLVNSSRQAHWSHRFNINKYLNLINDSVNRLENSP